MTTQPSDVTGEFALARVKNGKTKQLFFRDQLGVGAASYAELCILHLYLEELYESFVEVDRRRVSELTAARVITGRFNGAFCNFSCTKNVPK